MITIPRLFAEQRKRRRDAQNGTLTDEVVAILAAVYAEELSDAWLGTGRDRRCAAWAADALAALARLNRHARDVVQDEHAALVARLEVDEDGRTRWPWIEATAGMRGDRRRAAKATR